MTVIAYRNGVMAADTQVEWDHVKVNEPKVCKRRGYLFGIAGSDCPSLDVFVEWFFDKAAYEKPLSKYNFDALIAFPDGHIELWDHQGRHDPINYPFFAIGSGREVAFGCFERDGTAQDAVRAAIKWSPRCGGRVTVRKL